VVKAKAGSKLIDDPLQRKGPGGGYKDRFKVNGRPAAWFERNLLTAERAPLTSADEGFSVKQPQSPLEKTAPGGDGKGRFKA